MKIEKWIQPKLSPADIAAADIEVRKNPNELSRLAAEIRADAAQARKDLGCDAINDHLKAVDGEARRVFGIIGQASQAEQLLILRSAREYSASLRRQQETEYAAGVKRGFDRNHAAQLEESRRQARWQWQARQGKAITAPIDTLIDRLVALRGKLAPQSLREWLDELDAALDSCRGSVVAAIDVASDGAIKLREAA